MAGLAAKQWNLNAQSTLCDSAGIRIVGSECENVDAIEWDL